MYLILVTLQSMDGSGNQVFATDSSLVKSHYRFNNIRLFVKNILARIVYAVRQLAF